jgi:hypothetical protein
MCNTSYLRSIDWRVMVWGHHVRKVSDTLYQRTSVQHVPCL